MSHSIYTAACEVVLLNIAPFKEAILSQLSIRQDLSNLIYQL